MKAIEVIGIGKRYGAKPVLEGVSFEVEEGDAVALVGANGAGKTTLLRILATLLKPTSGFARIMELDGRFHAPRIRRILGYMPDSVGMEDDLTVEEYLEFFAALHGQGRALRSEGVKSLVSLLDLGPVKDSRCGSLSRGMQQRVGLARTLVHNPSVLLLDEPAANLDPRARIEIREVLKELRRMGKSILISSHILLELGELCNKILLIERGRILYFGSISAVAGKLRPRKRIALRAGGDSKGFYELLRSETAVESATEGDGWLRLLLRDGQEDYSFVARRAVERGVPLLGLREEEAGLEEIFMRLSDPKEPA